VLIETNLAVPDITSVCNFQSRKCD